jgi:hypothetical protein
MLAARINTLTSMDPRPKSGEKDTSRPADQQSVTQRQTAWTTKALASPQKERPSFCVLMCFFLLQ